MFLWQSQILKRVTKKSHPNGKKIRTEEIAAKKTEKITKPKYFCVLCGKVFLIESNLNLHKEKKHGQFTCSECNICYVAKEMLTSHIKKHHKKVSCPDCKSTFTGKALLKLHMQTHQKKFEICTECNNRFASRGNLQRHRRNIHGKHLRGKSELNNDNNTDRVKETEDKHNPRTNFHSTLASEKPMDIIEELDEFPLLEPDDMEEIFAEFGLTTPEIFEQVFKYLQIFQNIWSAGFKHVS